MMDGRSNHFNPQWYLSVIVLRRYCRFLNHKCFNVLVASVNRFIHCFKVKFPTWLCISVSLLMHVHFCPPREKDTALVLSKLKKINTTAPQPQRTVFKYFVIFKNVAHIGSLVRRRVTRRLTRLKTMYNVLKYRKTWWNDNKISIYRNRNATAMSI